MGGVRSALQSPGSEHVVVQFGSGVRLRTQVPRLRFRAVEPKQRYVQVQAAMGSAADTTSLALLGLGWEPTARPQSIQSKV
jgi:hypothetical protein